MKAGRISLAAWLACFFTILALLATPLFSQTTTSRIDGSILDESGAVVPNAKILAVNMKTQAKAETKSNDQGIFVFPAIEPGTYTLTIEAKGFQTQVVKNVEVNVAANVSQTYHLKVGQTTDTITVEANAVSVQTADSEIGRAITLRDIDTLPQLGRTPITLAVFQPGVQVNPGDVSFSHVNGLRGGSNNSKLDGIDINDSVVPRLGLSLTANNTDSIEEFRVVTEGGKAEYGRSAGAQIELVTRSGSNNYHGSAFDYLRNTDLNANDYFNKNTTTVTPRPKFIQNIFGGSFGGPILHDKTFIFGNYQGRRTSQDTVRNRVVLSDLARKGIFQWKDSSGAIRQFDIAANDSNPSNPNARRLGVDKQMAALFALVPSANNSDVGDGLNTLGFRFNNPTPSYDDQFTIRGDHNVTQNLKAFLRWSWQRNSSIDNLNNADPTYPGQPAGSQGGHRWGFAAGADWAISPSFFNEFRVGHQSASVQFVRPARPKGPAITTNLFNFAANRNAGQPINPAFSQGRNSPVNDITDNMTKVKGDHTFKWGTNIRLTTQFGTDDNGIYPDVTLSPTSNGDAPPGGVAPAGLSSVQTTTFNNLYNEVLGRMDQVAQTFYSRDLQGFQAPGTPRVRNYLLRESGYFFQDDWKLLRNLTLNLGVRYEFFAVPRESNKIQATLTNAGQINGINQLTNITAVQSTNWYKNDWNNFAPRVGFSWDMFGDGRTALRGNYGVFYDRTIGATVSTADGNTPGFSFTGTVQPQRLTPPAGVPQGDWRISDGIPIPAPSAPVVTLPFSGPLATRSTSVALFNPNLRTGYVQSYGLNIQRELMRNTILEVGYVGNRGAKLFMDQDFNQMRIGEDFLGAFKELQAFRAKTIASPSANNTLVRLFTNVPATVCATSNTVIAAANCAITNLGATNVDQGSVGAAANNVDRNFNNLYANIGLPQTYLRNYPQFNQVIVGTNAGRSYYDALQVSVRRSTGAIRMAANYTYSKGIDNVSVDGNGFTSTIDNYHVDRNRSLGDFDHRHSFNASTIYSLPFGRGQQFGANMPKWLDTVVGGWEVGSLMIIQDGTVFTVSSRRTTTHVTGTSTTALASLTWANYSGDHHAGEVRYQPDGSVFFFTPADLANFSFPAAGDIGNSGRNTFRGPRFFNVDMSLVKKFNITERQYLTFRAEAYNALNNPNFGGLTTDLTTPSTFGKLSTTQGAQGTGARTMQLTLRYDF